MMAEKDKAKPRANPDEGENTYSPEIAKSRIESALIRHKARKARLFPLGNIEEEEKTRL